MDFHDCKNKISLLYSDAEVNGNICQSHLM